MSAESLSFWADGLDDKERALRAVKAQKLIADLPAETYRRDRDLFNIRLYENNPIITLYNFAGRYYSDSGTMALPPPEQSTSNKAKAAIDTLASQIASTDVRARFLTSSADYRQRRRAREIQHFADGLAHELKLHRLKQRAFLDAAILESGVGAIQFYTEGGRVKAQRAVATEFSIDPLDGMIDGQPQTLYRRRPVPRERVKVMAEESDAAGEVMDAIERVLKVITGGAPADHIEVFEAWHLPTTEKSEDGFHVLTIDSPEGAPITVDKHTKPYHDTVFFSLEDRFATAWGLGLMTQVRGLQCRINANMYRIERAQKLFHAGHIYVPKEMKLKKTQINNEIGSIWEGFGPNPPQQIRMQCAAPELYQQVERDSALIFENLGISISAAQAETQAGIDQSGAAKREEVKKSDARNSVKQQRWEQFHLDLMRVALGKVRDLAASKSDGEERKASVGSYEVAVPGKRGMTSQDWKDVAMDEKDYVLDIQPASPIPTTPEGLVAQGEQMVQLGIWTPRELRGYYQDLDYDGRVNLEEADRRNLEETFEDLLYEKSAAAMPDEFTDLQLAIEIGSHYLKQGQADKVPDKHLERVRLYLRRCIAMTTPPPAPAAQPAGAGGTAITPPPLQAVA